MSVRFLIRLRVTTVSLVLSAAALSGCTSVGEIRNRPVVFHGELTGALDVASGCIADRLEMTGMPNVQIRPSGQGYTVMRVDQTLYGPDYVFVIDVRQGPPSTVTAYSALPLARGNQLIVQAIEACRNPAR